MSYYYDLVAWLDQYPLLSKSVQVILVIIFSYVAYKVTRKYLLKIIQVFVKKSKTEWDDVLLEYHFFTRLSRIVPSLVIYNFSFVLPEIRGFVDKVALSYIVFTVILAIVSFLKAVNKIYSNYKISQERPIKGYVQIVEIITYIIGVIIIISILMGKSPVILLSGLGAMTAVLMLIFKDTILSLVASLQLSFDNMVKIGDWITVPKYGADGDVMEIALHTIKVRNFDKTIVTIPTSKLLEASFQNWSGMVESGARRVKRSLNIDMTTIRLLTDEEINEFRKIKVLKEYIEQKEKEIKEYNSKDKDLGIHSVNLRKLTNIGMFRAYLLNYLKHHQMVHKDFILLVRQLPPSEKGLPIELYFFVDDTAWVNYEQIQSDIFDHILSVVQEFKLKIFQNPTGNDIAKFLENN